jgi:predicted nucleotidyltransferase
VRLAEVLDRLVAGARDALGENFVGAYQVGSFALGAGDAASDVDFLVATRRTPDVEPLAELHRTLPDLGGWAAHLEGSYAPLAELRRTTANAWLYVDNGHRTVQWSRHDNTPVVRWVAREHGITLAGPPPRDLIDAVTAEELRADALVTLRRWDEDLRDHPDQFGNLLAQQQHVLGLCRLLHRREQGVVLAKPAAAQSVIARDPQWKDLVERALDGRRLGWGRATAETPAQVVAETVRFHQWVMSRHATDGCAKGGNRPTVLP